MGSSCVSAGRKGQKVTVQRVFGAEPPGSLEAVRRAAKLRVG